MRRNESVLAVVVCRSPYHCGRCAVAQSADPEYPPHGLTAGRTWGCCRRVARTVILISRGSGALRGLRIPVPDRALTQRSRDLIRKREENYFKDRPWIQCQPTGPEAMPGWRRVIQTPSLIAFAYETLRYRLIFMDGRRLEADPSGPGWVFRRPMGRRHAGGRQLRVQRSDVADPRGMPHTEALRTTERYRRRSLDNYRSSSRWTDPGAFDQLVDGHLRPGIPTRYRDDRRGV